MTRFDAGPVAIRRAVPDDLDAVDALHKASIRALCSSCYSPEQVRDWVSALHPAGYLKAMEACEFMVAVEGCVVGLCIFNAVDEELTALYVSPERSGKGVGRALLGEVEAMARESGITVLHLKSTLNAVGFYERMGFTRMGRSGYVLPCGTELPCVLMTRRVGRRVPR